MIILESPDGQAFSGTKGKRQKKGRCKNCDALSVRSLRGNGFGNWATSPTVGLNLACQPLQPTFPCLP